MVKNSKKHHHSKPIKTFIRLAKDRGSIYITKAAEKFTDEIEYYGLNFIDRNIAPPLCHFQVTAIHHGHDHGFGIFHKHHFKLRDPVNLGLPEKWTVSLKKFLDEVDIEERQHYGSSTSFITHEFVSTFVNEAS